MVLAVKQTSNVRLCTSGLVYVSLGLHCMYVDIITICCSQVIVYKGEQTVKNHGNV